MTNKEMLWNSVSEKKLATSLTQYCYLPILTDWIKTTCKPLKSPKILDLGCYTAIDLMRVAKIIDGIFVGCDISSVALRKAKEEIGTANLIKRISLFQQDLDTVIPVPDKYFSISMCKYVLPFIVDKRAFLNEMMRITNVGIILAVPVVNVSLSSSKLSAKAVSICMESSDLHGLLGETFLSNTRIARYQPESDNSYYIEVIVSK